MKTAFLLSFLALYFHSYAQSNKLIYYLDKDFVPAAKQQSYYTGVAEPENGKIKFVAVVNTTRVVVLTGYFTDTSLTVRDGLFINYTDEGEEISRGAYVNNVKEGLWLAWDKGKLTDSVFLEKGDAVITTTYSYYSNGHVNTRNYKDNTTKTVEQTWWNEDGSLGSTAHWVDGEGERATYHATGQKSSVEKFKKSKVVSTTYYKEDGTEISKDALRKEERKSKKESEEKAIVAKEKMQSLQPEFPGGMAGFGSYFTKNFKAPQSLFEQVRSIERITIVFMLDKKGYATDIKIQEFSSFELHEAVRDVFNHMPAWNMKGYKSFGPVTYIINLQRGL
jgi:antitoxin component YwqK of YwqJK toxin-antitoxin module